MKILFSLYVCHSLNLAIKDFYNSAFIIIEKKFIKLIQYFIEISKTIENLSSSTIQRNLLVLAFLLRFLYN